MNFISTSVPTSNQLSVQIVQRSRSAPSSAGSSVTSVSHSAPNSSLRDSASCPKFSLFLESISLLKQPEIGGHLRGVDKAIGSLMFVPTTASDEIANNMAELFVQRVFTVMKQVEQIDIAAAEFYKSNPKEVLRIGLLSCAFSSRYVEEQKIKIGEVLIGLEEISHLSLPRQEHFVTICEMKNSIAKLHLSPDNDHAWTTLLELNQKFAEKNMTSLDTSQKDALNMINFYAETLCKEFTSDAYFQTAWANALEK